MLQSPLRQAAGNVSSRYPNAHRTPQAIPHWGRILCGKPRAAQCEPSLTRREATSSRSLSLAPRSFSVARRSLLGRADGILGKNVVGVCASVGEIKCSGCPPDTRAGWGTWKCSSATTSTGRRGSCLLDDGCSPRRPPEFSESCSVDTDNKEILVGVHRGVHQNTFVLSAGRPYFRLAFSACN